MLSATQVKSLALAQGAALCGIAPASRFAQAPKGFHPTDIFPGCQSVLVFAKPMPLQALLIDNIAPYNGAATALYAAIDRIGLELSLLLQQAGIGAVPVPCDTPYLHWEPERMHGMGTLSMRHAAQLAGLGVLGKNTLLLNQTYGNLLYPGAVLLDAELDPDPVIEKSPCPNGCRLCLEACPVGALDGITVNQARCRSISIAKRGRGFDMYCCNACRKACPRRSGY